MHTHCDGIQTTGSGDLLECGGPYLTPKVLHSSVRVRGVRGEGVRGGGVESQNMQAGKHPLQTIRSGEER